MNKIAIIGAGNMGSAIARALADSGRQVHIANPSMAKLNALRDTVSGHLISTTTDNKIAAANADLVILAVKPHLISKVIEEVMPVVATDRLTIVSLAAGIALEQLSQMICVSDSVFSEVSVVRMMPNIAATVGESMTFLCGNQPANDSGALAAVAELCRSFGQCAIVEERLFAPVMALASCGIAFALRYIRSNITGGITLGIKADDALKYTLQTIQGALSLIESEPRTHIEALIDRVCTPGGVTIRGLQAMEAAGFTTAVCNGLQASAK